MFTNCMIKIDNQILDEVENLKSEKIVKLLSLYGLYSRLSIQYPVSIRTWTRGTSLHLLYLEQEQNTKFEKMLEMIANCKLTPTQEVQVLYSMVRISELSKEIFPKYFRPILTSNFKNLDVVSLVKLSEIYSLASYHTPLVKQNDWFEL